MVEDKKENGRHLVEYEKGNKKFYTDAERFIDDKEDFSDRSQKGFGKLKKQDEEKYLEEKVK